MPEIPCRDRPQGLRYVAPPAPHSSNLTRRVPSTGERGTWYPHHACLASPLGHAKCGDGPESCVAISDTIRIRCRKKGTSLWYFRYSDNPGGYVYFCFPHPLFTLYEPPFSQDDTRGMCCTTVCIDDHGRIRYPGEKKIVTLKKKCSYSFSDFFPNYFPSLLIFFPFSPRLLM